MEVYLDHSATTRCCREAADLMVPDYDGRLRESFLHAPKGDGGGKLPPGGGI